MQACFELGSEWPGFTGKDTVVIPVDPRDWPPPVTGVRLDGLWFAPKRELHVTVLGTVLGAQVRQALAANRIRIADLADAFRGLAWTCRRTGPCVRLAKTASRAQDDVRAAPGALIELVDLPAMADFHRALALMLGTMPRIPPPHVTLYTLGEDNGIGLPDATTLVALAVPLFDPRQQSHQGEPHARA